MSDSLRVVNTAPLIFLAKLGRLELLHLEVDFVYVPPKVLEEIRVVTDEAAQAVEQALLEGQLVERGCTRTDLLAFAGQSLDPGEAEVIALALEVNTKDIVLDDLDARRFARRSGLEPIGTLGLLLVAKQRGILEAIGPEIEALRKVGLRVSEALVMRVLAEAGEE
jgi:hypothetical protein